MQLTFFEWNFTSNRCSIFLSFLRLWVLLLFHVVLPGMGMAIFSGNWSNLASHRTKRQSYFVWVTGSWLMAAHVGRVKKVWGEDAEIPQTKYCTKPHRACQNTKKNGGDCDNLDQRIFFDLNMDERWWTCRKNNLRCTGAAAHEGKEVCTEESTHHWRPFCMGPSGLDFWTEKNIFSKKDPLVTSRY